MFLGILIVVNGLAITIATALLVLDPGLRDAFGSFPGWFSAFLVVFLLARLIALYAIWNFKRWGVYAFLLLECLEVAMGSFVFTGAMPAFPAPLRALMAVTALLVLFAIWFLALRPRWRDFR